MAIDVSWGNSQKTIIVSAFPETWTLEDAHKMIDEMYQLTTSVDHTVHSIMDFTDSHTSPTALMSAGRHIEKRAVSNSGISVVVKAHSFLKAMMPVISKIFIKEAKLFFVDTRDEAYRIIEKHEKASIKN